MPKFRKKPTVVDAKGPLTEYETVHTANGPVEAGPGDYILTDPKTGDTWPINAEIFAKTYEPAAGESVDIGIRVQEEPPEKSSGIRFMTIVRIDRNTFQAANPKDARLMVRRQFKFALPPLDKVVDEEHVKLNTPEPKPA